MYDFLVHNQQYIVLLVVLTIWFGLFILIFRLDKKLSKLEKIINENNKASRNKGNKL
ncbi:MAG: CcmD family protein [Candidatus Kapaibacteriales bacterium]